MTDSKAWVCTEVPPDVTLMVSLGREPLPEVGDHAEVMATVM